MLILQGNEVGRGRESFMILKMKMFFNFTKRLEYSKEHGCRGDCFYRRIGQKNAVLIFIHVHQ